MTNWDRVERLLGETTMEQLAQKTVGIVGLGSGGGYVALALAMTGIQHFVLIDDDNLDPHNIVRHVADNRYLNRPKINAVAELIMQRNTDAKVDMIHGRVEDHLEQLDEFDILVSGVDSEAAKFAINQACLEHGLLAVYAGVYERGEGGDVVIIHPYDGPCYACWASKLRDGFITPAPDGSDAELDYGQVRPDGTLDAEPGLWLDVVRVANTQANMVLNLLLKGTKAERELPANTVILANQPLEIVEGHITPPFSAEWVTIERDPHCLVCGSMRSKTAHSTLSLDALLGNAIGDDLHEVVKKTGTQDND
jgi:hypothetical protein